MKQFIAMFVFAATVAIAQNIPAPPASNSPATSVPPSIWVLITKVLDHEPGAAPSVLFCVAGPQGSTICVIAN